MGNKPDYMNRTVSVSKLHRSVLLKHTAAAFTAQTTALTTAREPDGTTSSRYKHTPCVCERK